MSGYNLWEGFLRSRKRQNFFFPPMEAFVYKAHLNFLLADLTTVGKKTKAQEVYLQSLRGDLHVFCWSHKEPSSQIKNRLKINPPSPLNSRVF